MMLLDSAKILSDAPIMKTRAWAIINHFAMFLANYALASYPISALEAKKLIDLGII